MASSPIVAGCAHSCLLRLRARCPKESGRVLRPEAATDREDQAAARPKRHRLSWAQLLHRVLFVDALRCVRCGGRRKVLAFLSDPPLVQRILQHLGMAATAPPVLPARRLDGELWWMEYAGEFDAFSDEPPADLAQDSPWESRAPP